MDAMAPSAVLRPAPGPPGRRSLAEWTRLVDTCLKDLDHPMRLRRSPLVKLPGVARFAERRHPANPHGRVLALQELVMRAVDVSLPALSPRERRFLERYASGRSIAAIGREMGMSRSHLSSVYRPTVGEAVAVALRRLVDATP